MKINVNDSTAVKAILGNVQKRAKTRCFRYSEINDYMERLEAKLANLEIPKKYRPGTRAVIGNESFPGAYKYIPIGTIINLERGGNNWFITACYRTSCDGKNHIVFTEKQKEIIAENAIRAAESLT